MSNRRLHPLVPAIAALTSALSAAPAALAQSPGAQLEEVMVTAQKREQSLQDVPASVSAFSAESIEEAGWRDISGMQQAVPELEIGGESRVRPFVSIRGVGTRKFDIGADGSVGLFIDEVYTARFSSLMTGIMDVERMEVLKGPQGTLYGRNTIGGAINIYSRRPTDEVEGKVTASIANYDSYQVGASISGPISGETLLGRLSASTSDIEGVQEDTVSGKDDNNNLDNARLSLIYLPDEAWDLTFTTDYAKIESDASLTDPQPGEVFGVMLVSPVDPRVPGVVAEGEKDSYSNEFSIPGYVDLETLQFSLTAKHQGDTMDFLSITSYTDEDYSEARDFDGTVLQPMDQIIDQDSQQFSQEFRLSSVGGGFGTMGDRLQWVAGIYYFEDDAERYDGFPQTPDSVLYFPPLGGAVDLTEYIVELETTSWAAYGQATYAITDKLNLTLGLRYTDDEKEFVYTAKTNSPLPFAPVPFTTGDTLNFDSTDPRITLDYHFNDDIMAYATYSTGFKSGGVQYAVGFEEVALTSFDPEELENIELGIKSRLLDETLQLNASVFQYDYTDQQVQSIILLAGAPTGLTQNAAESDMTGLELEIVALLTDALTFELRYSWLDAEYDKFVTLVGDYSGNKMAAAPEHAYVASLRHVTDFDNWGSLTLDARYSWRDDQYFNFANDELAFQEDYGLLGLGAWWDLPEGNTRIRVFCENCTDEEYMLNFTSFPDPFGGGRRSWDYGRRYGIEVSYIF